MNCMTTTTHTMAVELSHKVVVSFMRWLFCEATTSFYLFLSLLRIIKNPILSFTSPKILCGIALDDL
jgi:hypothetical protein